jgi:hypothetical protein
MPASGLEARPAGTKSGRFFARLIANLELRKMGTLQETDRNVRYGEFSSPTPYVISKI